jgi:ketosteroid isomerase-like protein
MTGKKPIFATALDAEAAFYEAIEHGDLEAMMSVWAEDEEIICVLPSGPRLAGYMNVRDAWRRLFERGVRLHLQVSQQSVMQNPFSAVHNNLEALTVIGDESPTAAVVATNVFIRGPLGWRLIVHHASPAPPDSIGEAPKTLH